jgi:hypothetical protein
MIALLFATFVCFAGYRFFLVLLPIWGFFFGFALGVQSIQALIGDGSFATVTSWAVGFVVALLFAVLAYLFYIIAVAIIAGSLGYGLTVSILGAIGLQFGFLTWLIAIVVAVAFAFVTLRYNLAKYVIIIATALGGAALAIGTLLLGPGQVDIAQIFANPIQALFSVSWFWGLIFLAMAIGGIVVQWRASQSFELTPYENRI